MMGFLATLCLGLLLGFAGGCLIPLQRIADIQGVGSGIWSGLICAIGTIIAAIFALIGIKYGINVELSQAKQLIVLEARLKFLNDLYDFVEKASSDLKNMANKQPQSQAEIDELWNHFKRIRLFRSRVTMLLKDTSEEFQDALKDLQLKFSDVLYSLAPLQMSSYSDWPVFSTQSDKVLAEITSYAEKLVE